MFCFFTFELIKNLQMQTILKTIGTFFVSVKVTGIKEKCVFFLVDKFYVDIEDEIKKLEKYNI